MLKLILNQVGFWFAAVFLFLSGCKTNEPVYVKHNYSPEQIVPSEKALLWKISGYGLKKPSYLYGTIHMIPRDKYQVPDPVKQALEASKKITFEIDLKDMFSLRAQFSLLTKSFMQGGKTLKDLLSPEDYKFVKAKLTEKQLPGMFERLKPMFLSMMLSNENSDPTSNTGEITSVEMEVYNIAKDQEIPSDGLETVGYQMSIFDSIPYEVQAQMLVESLRGTEKSLDGESELDKMVDMYISQDIQSMQSMIAIDSSGFGQYEDVILSKRNENWIPEMSKMMRVNPTFFAVGAGHLGGERGVIALLRKAGYQVEVY